MVTLKEHGASMPYQETELPRNVTPHIVNENSGFLCSNEFFNPNFSENVLGTPASSQRHCNATASYATHCAHAPHANLQNMAASQGRMHHATDVSKMHQHADISTLDRPTTIKHNRCYTSSGPTAGLRRRTRQSTRRVGVCRLLI